MEKDSITHAHAYQTWHVLLQRKATSDVFHHQSSKIIISESCTYSYVEACIKCIVSFLCNLLMEISLFIKNFIFITD